MFTVNVVSILPKPAALKVVQSDKRPQGQGGVHALALFFERRCIVSVQDEYSPRCFRDLPQPLHGTVEMVENSQREHDVELAIGLAPKLLDVSELEVQVGKFEVLAQQACLSKVTAAGLATQRFNATLGQSQRESTLETTQVGRAQPGEVRAEKQIESTQDGE